MCAVADKNRSVCARLLQLSAGLHAVFRHYSDDELSMTWNGFKQFAEEFSVSPGMCYTDQLREIFDVRIARSVAASSNSLPKRV